MQPNIRFGGLFGSSITFTPFERGRMKSANFTKSANFLATENVNSVPFGRGGTNKVQTSTIPSIITTDFLLSVGLPFSHLCCIFSPVLVLPPVCCFSPAVSPSSQPLHLIHVLPQSQSLAPTSGLFTPPHNYIGRLF